MEAVPEPVDQAPRSRSRLGRINRPTANLTVEQGVNCGHAQRPLTPGSATQARTRSRIASTSSRTIAWPARSCPAALRRSISSAPELSVAASRMLDSPNLRDLDDETRAMIAEHGLRNGCLTSIAPTGTTSLLAGNVSSGIEPVFAYSYTRRIREPDGSMREEAVEDHAFRVWKQLRGDEPPPPDLFVSAQTLGPADHLAMQAAAQALIDSSISKTINVPEDIPFEHFADIYAEGYRLGCKGMTTNTTQRIYARFSPSFLQHAFAALER